VLFTKTGIKQKIWIIRKHRMPMFADHPPFKGLLSLVYVERPVHVRKHDFDFVIIHYLNLSESRKTIENIEDGR
jgi:hypothetical protein